jgi:hypothetical protein
LFRRHLDSLDEPIRTWHRVAIVLEDDHAFDKKSVSPTGQRMIVYGSGLEEHPSQPIT